MLCPHLPPPQATGYLEVALDPLTNKTGDVWHVCVHGLKDLSSLCYGWRAAGHTAWEGEPQGGEVHSSRWRDLTMPQAATCSRGRLGGSSRSALRSTNPEQAAAAQGHASCAGSTGLCRYRHARLSACLLTARTSCLPAPLQTAAPTTLASSCWTPTARWLSPCCCQTPRTPRPLSPPQAAPSQPPSCR